VTYARFLGLFVLLPILASAYVLRADLRRGRFLPLLLLLVVVYAATTPWDNHAVASGLWDFDNERTWGVRLIHLPVEEYLFFGLQTVLTGLWVRARLARLSPSTQPARPVRASGGGAP